MTTPKLSILIPNFDNGRRSSLDGRTDFLGNLLASLERTLVDDPTPLEILVCDDGSTDDSIETARQWASRTWPGWRAGQPFIELIEREHTGHVAVVANELSRRARGAFFCRLDGDVTAETPGWAQTLLSTFDTLPPDVGILGPKQLGPDGRVHAFGSWILHPRGHHHFAAGAEPHAVSRSVEIDHVMGCFWCHRRDVWVDGGGYDEALLRGQTIDLALKARLHGWRSIAVPTVDYVHHHRLRAPRATRADTPDGIDASLDTFRASWGFDRLAPNLDDVRERYAGTPLLWNPAVFGPASAWPPPATAPVPIERSEWSRFTTDEAFRAAVQLRVEVARDLLRSLEVDTPRVLQLQSRAGLLAHLLAESGLGVTAVDTDPHAIELARSVTARRGGNAPIYLEQRGRTIPIEDGSTDVVIAFDVVETHANPVALFREARRVLAPDGVLLILSRERASSTIPDADAHHPYMPHELAAQLRATRCFEPLDVECGVAVPGCFVMAARRQPSDGGSANVRDVSSKTSRRRSIASRAASASK